MSISFDNKPSQDLKSLLPEPIRDAVGLGHDGNHQRESRAPEAAQMILGSLAAALTMSMPPRDSIFDRQSSGGLTDLGSAEAEKQRAERAADLSKLSQVGLPPGVTINEVMQQAQQLGGSMASLTNAMLQLKERLGRDNKS